MYVSREGWGSHKHALPLPLLSLSTLFSTYIPSTFTDHQLSVSLTEAMLIPSNLHLYEEVLVALHFTADASKMEIPNIQQNNSWLIPRRKKKEEA